MGRKVDCFSSYPQLVYLVLDFMIKIAFLFVLNECLLADLRRNMEISAVIL